MKKKQEQTQFICGGNSKNMALKDTEDTYIYLSSIASGNTFPDNTSSEFENRILPVHLDPNREYEVGLSNILFPKYFYCIRGGDPNCGIDFYGRIKQSDFDDYDYKLYTYLPERNMISNFSEKNIVSIARGINSQMMRELQVILGASYKDFFPYREIIYYDLDLERVVVNESIASPDDDRVYTDIFITFAPHIAFILGFDPNFRYTVFFQKFGEEVPVTPEAGKDLNQEPIKLIAPHVARPDSGNDYLYVYSDVISPTRFGNQIVNILDAIPLPHDVTSKGVNPIMYKRVALSHIQSIAIKITNQNGRPIYFDDGHSVTCVLHIRPR